MLEEFVAASLIVHHCMAWLVISPEVAVSPLLALAAFAGEPISGHPALM